jgi:hypothetical protein
MKTWPYVSGLSPLPYLSFKTCTNIVSYSQTPQRPDSVKKPKIKLNTSSTPKAANGSATSKPKDESAVKAKSKAKKAKDGAAEKKAEVAKEAKMTPEERRARKEVSERLPNPVYWY